MAWSQGDEGTDQRIVPSVDRIRAAARLAPDGGVLPVIGAIRFALRVVCGLSRRGGVGGDEETRTPDPLLAKEMLCQLSYVPSREVVGVSGLEPETSALSGQCSNQLS